MIIAKEYGYAPELSGLSDNKSSLEQTPVSEKTKPSEFDMLLSFFQNSSIGKIESERNESSSTMNRIDNGKENSEMQTRNESEVSYDNSIIDAAKNSDHSMKESETSVQKKEGLSNTKENEPSKLKEKGFLKKDLVDAGYIAEINKKVNHLLDKIKQTSHPSEEQTKQVAAELHLLSLQFQKFSFRLENSKEEGISLEKTGSKNPKDKLLDQLLSRMGQKLDTAKQLLKDMDMASRSLTSKVLSTQKGVDLQLVKLKAVDEELDKTLHLLKDLKQLSKDGQDILKKDYGLKQGELFSSASFSKDAGHINKTLSVDSHKIGVRELNHSASSKTLETSDISSKVNLTNTHSNSSHSEDNNSSKDNAWNMNGVSGGLLQGNKMISDTPSLDSSSLGFREKVQLGQEILNQMAQGMRGSIGKNESHFSISLKPEELGEVKILLDMKDGVIKSHIVVENELVKDILKERFQDLSKLFTDNGVNVSEFGVYTNDEFQKNENSSHESIQGIFETQKHLAAEVKLQRYLGNHQESYWAYEKMDDTQNTLKNFTITI